MWKSYEIVKNKTKSKSYTKKLFFLIINIAEKIYQNKFSILLRKMYQSNLLYASNQGEVNQE